MDVFIRMVIKVHSYMAEILPIWRKIYPINQSMLINVKNNGFFILIERYANVMSLDDKTKSIYFVEAW